MGQERDLIVEDFLELNKLTLLLHEAIDIMSQQVKECLDFLTDTSSLQDDGDQEDLKNLFAKVRDEEQEEDSDTNKAESRKQFLAKFIAETSSCVDMPKLVNDHPWLLEVGKHLGVDCRLTGEVASSSMQTPAGSGSGIELEEIEIETRTMSFCNDRFLLLKRELAQAKAAQRDSFEFDGYKIRIEYAQMMIDKIDITEKEKANWLDDGINWSDPTSIHLDLLDASEGEESRTSDADEEAEDVLLPPASTTAKTKPHQKLPWVFCIAGMLFAVIMFMMVAFYVRRRAYEVINVDKQLILCQNQNFAQVVTEWVVQDLLDTVQRSAQLVAAGSATTYFSSSQIGGTFPAVMMGVMNSGDGTVLCM